MVCNRCKMVVKSITENLGLHPLKVNLGVVYLLDDDISHLKQQLKLDLRSFGFELLEDINTIIIEKTKILIIDLVHHKYNNLSITLSEYLSQELHEDYRSLSNIFTKFEGVTIEKFYVDQKIEKVKELLLYDELTLSQISYQLNYSSVAYLSNQFKKATGLTPTSFKKFRSIERKPLDEL